jgi:hypothetical protein
MAVWPRLNGAGWETCCFSSIFTTSLPWLIAAGFAAVQGVVMWFAPVIPAITAGFAAYAAIPAPVTLALGIAAGGAAAWLGWEAGKTPARRAAAAAG